MLVRAQVFRRLERDAPDIARKVVRAELPFGQCGGALEHAEVIEEKFSVEMIDLVLEAARKKTGRIALELLAVPVEGTDRNALRPFDVGVNVRDGETSLLSLRLSRRRQHDLGIDDDERIVAQINHREPHGLAHLRRGEPDAARMVHRVEHVVDQALQLIRDRRDRCRRLPENRISEHANVEDAHRRRLFLRCRRARARANDARDPAPLDDEAGLGGLDGDLILQAFRRLAAPGLLHVNHLADDSAGRHDLVAALDVPECLFVFLFLCLLRPDEEEVEDAEDGDDLKEQGRQAPAGTATELEGEKRGEQGGVRHTEVVAVRE